MRDTSRCRKGWRRIVHKLNHIDMRTLLLILAIGMTGSLYSQQFELYKELGDNRTKSKLFSSEHYIEMDVDFTPKDVECEDQDYVYLRGSIMDMDRDSFSFFTHTIYNGYIFDCAQSPQARKYLTTDQIVKIAIEDVTSLYLYKSRKQEQRSERLAELGFGLVFSSLVTATTALIIGGEQRRDFLIASGAQLGLGITFGLISVRHGKDLSNTNNPWQLRKYNAER